MTPTSERRPSTAPTPLAFPAPAPIVPPPPAVPGANAVRQGPPAHAQRSPSTPPDPIREDAAALVARCEAELLTNPDSLRAARLHYEIARVEESPIGDLRRAAAHYQEAFVRTPEHLPTIRAARRVLIARKNYASALPLFDAEARITPDPRQKAALLFAKGRMLEDLLGQRNEARDAYAAALELDRGDAAILKAIEQFEASSEAWDALARTYEKSANSVATDPRHRAALIVARAKLVERRGELDAAMQLYETALKLDTRQHVAVDALKLLYHAQKRWRDLIHVLEREVEQSSDHSIRSNALYRIARLHLDQLGNRDESTNALERAAQETPDDPLVLEELSRLYEAAERWDALVRVLERRASKAVEPAERLGLLHRIGQLSEERLRDEDKAIRQYEGALATQPTFLPALQALGKLYGRRNDWSSLIAMHLREAEATDDPKRRANAHSRIAETYEVELGRLHEAMEHHARSLALAPGYTPSFKALTRLYAAAGMYRELVELYERAVDGAPDAERAITYLMKVGALYEDHLGDPAQAAHAYRRVLGFDASHLGAIHALQRATERAGRYQELVEALELEAEKTRDQDIVVSLLHQAGEVLDDKLGDRDGALLRFRKVLAVNPTYLPALTSLGRIYYRSGRWEDLLEMYRRELEVTPRGPASVALLLKMGELCEERVGRDDESLACYRRAIEVEPTCAPAIRALSRKLRERGDWEELVRVLELELTGLADPATRAAASYRLAEVIEVQLGQPDRALPLYEQALVAVPDHHAASEALMRLRTERRSFAKLVQDLGEHAARTRDPRAAVAALLRQGELWAHEMRDPRKAIASYEAVLEREPAHLGAVLALETLYRQTASWEQLARMYAMQARICTDTGARVAALRELARVQEHHHIGGTSELRTTYEAILALSPDDVSALAALEKLALDAGDRRAIVNVHGKLARLSSDPALVAAYETRVAEALEAEGDPAALDAYRHALTNDPESIGATRGLARIAENMNDPVVLAEAARQEASVARDGQAAARLFVRSAAVRIDALGDIQGGQADLERALELCPDDVEAARRLTALLLESNQIGRLVDLLSRAAGSAKQPERIAALWMEVARLHADVLDNLPGAIGSLHRVLKSTPNHVPTLVRLAKLFERDGQWTEAANLLLRVVQLAPDERETLRDAHVELATIWAERLGETERAQVSLQAALALDPGHKEALARLAKVHADEHQLDRAVEMARRLVRASSEPSAHAEACVLLSSIERKRGNLDAAAEALHAAVAIEGPHGSAANEYRALLAELGGWDAYANAIIKYVSTAGGLGTALAPTFLELARVQGDLIEQPEEAVETLQQGLTVCGPLLDLRMALATRLRRASRLNEAADEWRKLLSTDVANPQFWRELAATFDEMGRRDDAVAAINALSVLGAASGAERDLVRARGPRTGAVRPAGADADAVRLAQVQLHREPFAEELLATIQEGIGKLYPFDIEGFGLSTRDRITAKTGGSLRALVDRLASICGVPQLDLYVHRVRARGIAVEMSSPPSLLLPATLLELPESHQVYAIVRALVNIARGFHAVDKLTPREIEILLASAARSVNPTFGAGLTSEDFLDDHAKRLNKALSRKTRAAMQEAAVRYITAPAVDFPQWVRSVSQTAARIALVVCDDLAAATEMTRRSERELSNLELSAFLRASESASDLMRFWVSEPAAGMRRRLGIIG